jgi:hypothetical protein
MVKLMTFEHLENGKRMEVEFHVVREGDHWAARLRQLDEKGEAVRAPVFYGATVDQAERQLRKVFEREYDLVGQRLVDE